MNSIVKNNDGCAICSVPTTRFCSACKLIKYCSRDHQRQHWNIHKKQCRPFSMESDEILGRYLVATRDIKEGSIVFVEDPLLVGPKWYVPEQEDECVSIIPCVVCYGICRGYVVRCPRCHWPICGEKCLKNTKAHSVECKILACGHGPKNESVQTLADYYRYDALLVLKCLLLQVINTEKWRALMNMQSHEEERQGTELQGIADRRIVLYLESNYLKHLNASKKRAPILDVELTDYSAKIMHRICGIIETNYMCINTSLGVELSGIFYTACMMEHSCQPNCYFLFDEQNGFRISVMAGRKICKGEHLKIMYTNMLWSTQMRNEHLLMTKHFTCKCARCNDPTELGTYFSALKCLGHENQSCDGVQLPKYPLNCDTDWQCNLCGMSLSGPQVNYMTTQMNEEAESLLGSKPSIKQMERLLEKLSKFLHPGHYIMFTVKHSLIQLYDNKVCHPLDQFGNEVLNKKLHLCNELWDICKRLDPHLIRLSIYAAIILYEQHTVYLTKYKFEHNCQKIVKEKPRKENLATLARNALQEASELLKKELDNSAVKQLHERIQNAIDKLNKEFDKLI